MDVQDPTDAQKKTLKKATYFTYSFAKHSSYISLRLLLVVLQEVPQLLRLEVGWWTHPSSMSSLAIKTIRGGKSVKFLLYDKFVVTLLKGD